MKDLYTKLYADIRDKKYFLLFSVSLFLLSAASTVIAPSPEVQQLTASMLEGLRGMAQGFQTSLLPDVIIRLFIHNALATLFAVTSGAFFAILPVLSIIVNGYIAGVVLIPNLESAGLILPHGIFELPAYFLATSYGIWLGLWPFGKNRLERIRLRIMHCIRLYFLVLLPLLFVAAIIESTLIKYLTAN